ncbi:PH domain-containing protein [Nakamurella sp. YIM 132087]|uniref:PH domain-containing protein n=1 Tax=Nakamurella alba TaxID=2665158 RepID=A0A7K1FG58_9ACTN|nr:PH domain-containing protein [Nakamurella alba]MTD13087.1 PH domain-containing protein [Nakamurella alba]
MPDPAAAPAPDPAPPAPDTAPLPGDDGQARHRLPRRSLTYQLVWVLLVGMPVSAAVITGAAMLSWFTPGIRWVIAGLVVLYLLPVRLILTPLWWQRFWYAVSPDEVDVRHGVLLTTRTVVPMNRVQHLAVTHGPLADRFGVATVHIHTAAGEITLHDLDAAEAEAVRARLAVLAGLAGPGDDI